MTGNDSAQDLPFLHVFTFKEGLLSAVAHDLRLHLGGFTVELEGGTLRARFDLSSLRVDGVMRDGRLDADALSARDHAKIEKTTSTDVLDSKRFPEASFEGVASAEGDGFRVHGTLALHGRTGPVDVEVARAAGRLRGEARFSPSAWGIRPYRALGGTLKVRDAVRVEVVLPTAGLDPDRGVEQAHRWERSV